jgi:hypothetical protein
VGSGYTNGYYEGFEVYSCSGGPRGYEYTVNYDIEDRKESLPFLLPFRYQLLLHLQKDDNAVGLLVIG